MIEAMCVALPFRVDGEELEFAATRSKLWPKGTRNLSVRFLDGDLLLQQRVADHINRHDGVNANSGLKFVFDGADDAEIRVSFDGQGNWSYIGIECLEIALDEPTLNLGPDTHNGRDAKFQRTVEHEFLHALGVEHEQANPNANIPWDVPAVVEYYHSQFGLSRAEAEANVLNVLNGDDTIASEWDRDSVMGYEILAQLVTVPEYTIRRTKEMSVTDKEYLRSTYPLD
jgi:serralysin